MSREEWEARWWQAFVYYKKKNDHYAFEKAHDFMERTYGKRPDGPPSVTSLALRFWWLHKVKKMDLRKLIVGGVSAFVVGFLAVLPALMDQGLTQAELLSAVAAGLAALGLYLKDPNAHKGPDLR